MNSFNLKGFILKKGSGSFLVQFTAALSGVLLSMLLANNLSPDEFGKFYFCLSLVLVIALICQIGTPLFLTKEVSVLEIDKKYTGIISRIIYSFSITSFITLLGIFILLILIKKFEITFFNEYSSYIYLILLSIPLIVFINIIASIYRGFGYVVYAIFIDGCLGLLLTLFSSFLVINNFGNEITGPLIFRLYTLSLFIALIISLGPALALKNKNRYISFRKLKIYENVKSWNKSLFYFAIMSIAVVANDHLSLLILGILNTHVEVGYFKIAIQLSLIVIFGLNAINSIIGPKIASLYAEKRLHDLQILLTYSVRFSFIYALLATATIYFIGRIIINYFFGDQYSYAYLPLLILCIGQFFNVCFGSVGWIVNMTGREDYSAKILLLSLLINVLLTLSLAPSFGSIGVAISAALSLLFWNVALYRFILKEFNLNPSIFYILNTQKYE